MPDRPQAPTPFELQLPVESAGGEPNAGQKLKAVAKDAKGRLHVTTFELDAHGNGTARFALAENPGPLEVAVAPADFDDEEIHGLQTVTTRVDTRALAAGKPLRAAPLVLSAVLRRLWKSWCRTFTVHGRVICPDGRPVPGAEVQAYDVDFWWWWRSRQRVGPTVTTNVNGEFEIRFRWCCGFRPLWWWARRRWQLEPALADHILPVLSGLDKPLRPVPQPTPDLAVFGHLLGVREAGLGKNIDPAKLETLRERLLSTRRLPHVPALERLRIWPWFPWRPWFDCNPDLIFRVTQACQGPGTAIVNEGLGSVRWNVPTELTVTLVANESACCLPVVVDPEGACGLLGAACGRTLAEIGGNLEAPPSPAALHGYAEVAMPGAQDRPFGEAIALTGKVGTDVDYYLIQASEGGTGPWLDLPEEAIGTFSRSWWNTLTNEFPTVSFARVEIDGRQVYESRRRYETLHPGPWNGHQFWITGIETVASWLSQHGFDDGLYVLRLKGFRLGSDGKLVDLSPDGGLPECGDPQQQALLRLRIDNRLVEGASGHPTAPDHPCGPGTIHTCTREPDTDILAVRFRGNPVQPCDVIDGRNGGDLEIDFMAHDPDGHLGSYSLDARGGENASANLLAGAVPGVSLISVPAPPSSSVPAADFVGPTYSSALAQGAPRPTWRGGVMRLIISDVRSIVLLAAPDGRRCITQLELTATKRTLVNCIGAHENVTQYGFLMLL